MSLIKILVTSAFIFTSMVAGNEVPKDPTECHLMTWDLYGIDPKSCRGPSCFRPYFSGLVQPDPAVNETGICNMLRSESCVKYVIYDELEKKKPIFVSRFCDHIFTKDWKKISNSCHRINNVEICVCTDKNMCNDGAFFKSNLVLVGFLVLISILHI